MTEPAGIYLRQSLDVQEGIERQRERATKLIDARGWAFVGEYVDNDVTASKPRGRGTAWARLLDDLGADRVRVVVAVDLDRLLRTTRDLNTLIDHGAKVVTVDGEIDLSSADGEFRATMLAGIARFESRRKGERQQRANAARATKGKWVGGRRPFGFEPDGVTLRPAEAAAIRDGFTGLLNGLSLAAVAREWNAKGFTTGQTRQARSGHAGEPSPWRAYGVRHVLKNPRYMGRVRYKGEILTTPAEWPAIVDEATFQAVQAVLANPSRRTSGRSARHLLTGIAVCGVCGAHVHAGGNARKGVPSYRCSASTGHFARMAKPVEEFLSRVVVARLSRADARELLHRRDLPDVDQLRADASGLRERLEAVAVDYADGNVTAAQLRAATERIRARLTEVEAQLADAGRVDVLGDLIAAQDVAAAWDSLPLERRRAVVSTLMRVVLHPPGRGTRTFRPETVGIEWVSDPT